MLIKTTLIAAVAAVGLSWAAMADGPKSPLIMDDQALDAVTAGATLVHNYYTAVGVELQTLKTPLSHASFVSPAIEIDEYHIGSCCINVVINGTIAFD